MRKLQWRFMILLYFIVMVSALLSILFSTVLRILLYPGGSLPDTLLFGVALKDLLLPFMLVVFAAVFIGAASKKFVSPIVDISNATKEIAFGNFDVRIAETGRMDEIGDLQRNFNRMAKELQSNEYLKKDFISNVSHEFKTPLSVIQGYAKLLVEADVPSAERMEYAMLIAKESERLSILATNILRLSKIDNQEIGLKAVRFFLDEQIRQAVLLLEPKWSGKHIKFDIKLPEESVVGDEELLSQVWVNLIDNSIKFNHSKGKIDIRMRTLENGILVEISDNGIGMSPETQKRIFDQFYQGDSSHSKEGNGLGLSIVKRIVDMHGGKIEVQTAPGEGTTFKVWLPIQGEGKNETSAPVQMHSYRQ